MAQPHRHQGVVFDHDPEEEERLLKDEVDDKARQQSEYTGVNEVNWAVGLRHSIGYLWFTLATLGVNIGLFAWVLTAKSSKVTARPVFLALELLVTLAVIFDFVVQVTYSGGIYRFFLHPWPTSGVYSSTGLQGCCATYGLVAWNWAQVLVLLLCIVGFLLSLITSELALHGAPNINIEEEVSLSLILVRYIVFATFMVISQWRTLTVQGGFVNVVRSNSLYETGGYVNKAWDVAF